MSMLIWLAVPCPQYPFSVICASVVVVITLWLWLLINAYFALVGWQNVLICNLIAAAAVAATAAAAAAFAVLAQVQDAFGCEASSCGRPGR